MTDIKLKFFARLKEQTGTDELSIPAEQATTVDELKVYLRQQYPQWQHFLDARLMAAVNQTMVQGNPELHAGDEVALFPPVTGG
ncbi:MAG: molybdopterin converting factor subunit 1 [Reinekea sp.]|jgi:sulfur-carrier protein